MESTKPEYEAPKNFMEFQKKLLEMEMLLTKTIESKHERIRKKQYCDWEDKETLMEEISSDIAMRKVIEKTRFSNVYFTN